MQNTNKEEDATHILKEAMTDMVREDYAAIRKERQRMIYHRTASAAIALVYLTLGLFLGGTLVVVRLALFLILPLAAIWFADELGLLTGVRFGRFAGPPVTAESPGVFVRIAGWILLLLPVIAGIITGVLW